MENTTRDGATATATATMTATASGTASGTGGGNGGASRTFQSLFGHASESLSDGDARIAPMEGRQTEGSVQEKKGGGEEGDVWDDDFPSDANMESADEDNEELNDGYGKAQSPEGRQSMSDWVDNDDDEDNWKDALQARVDQLELVVERKILPQQSLQLNAALQADTDHTVSQVATTGTTTTALYAPPVDQRATLTLLPKTNLLRSISAPPAAEPRPEELKPASKIKTLHSVRVVTPSAGASSGGGGVKPKGNTKQPGETVISPSNQVQARKRSNSRDFAARPAIPAEQRRLPKTPPAAMATTASNSVFVRAVVSRGNSAGGRSAETRITNDGHVDKRAKGDDRAAVLALSDAEAVRRHILNDVKKISIERIVADAKRLQFLEDLHRRLPDATSAESQQRVSAASHSSGGGDVTKSAPTKNHAV